MIKEIGIKKEGEVIEYYGITLADDMVGQGLKKDEKGVVSVDVENLEINEEKLVKVTWAELKALRDEAKLNAGTFYRITDYVTTTTQSETKSANHPFDVIVLALSENTLCEEAKAILHEGDTYFADSDLSAWELKYCLDNNKTRFEWADETNGKGVIYRMVDEKRNDCPYDFKNVLFYNTKLITDTTSDKYYYTFSYVVSSVLYDGTTEKQVKNCYGNKMGEYMVSGVLKLNKNVFRDNAFLYTRCCNTFGDDCHSNTFGFFCYSNKFGDRCTYNTFGDDCQSNNLGDDCSSNTFGSSCSYNKFGDRCVSNTFGGSCSYNTFGHYCTYNKFMNDCSNNKFGDSCSSNTFGDNYYYRKLESGSEKAVINLSEEFYDDGSGQVVPVKHPDLSTQPSILPYKFMGQYVYEQLIPDSLIQANPSGIGNFTKDILNVQKPIFISASAIRFKNLNLSPIYEPVYIKPSDIGVLDGVMIDYSAVSFQGFEFDVEGYYIKIVYTSMPEEGDYYGYNN